MRRLGIPHLVARGIDLDLDNRAERVQALRVARRMAYAAPEQFPEAVARLGEILRKRLELYVNFIDFAGV